MTTPYLTVLLHIIALQLFSPADTKSMLTIYVCTQLALCLVRYYLFYTKYVLHSAPLILIVLEMACNYIATYVCMQMRVAKHQPFIHFKFFSGKLFCFHTFAIINRQPNGSVGPSGICTYLVEICILYAVEMLASCTPTVQ